MNKLLKILIRVFYRLFPFKKQIFSTLQILNLDTFLPNKIKIYLSFTAPFSVSVGRLSFKLLNGYGREVETMIFWNGLGAFEGETMPYWMKLSSRSNVILDIGANTGVYSLVSSAVNPAAEIHAFEPIGRVFDILNENIQINSKDHQKIFAHRMALSDYTGKGVMYDLPVEHMYTASLNKDIHAERGNKMQSCIEEVKVSRLDEFLGQQNCNRVDLIKIDVESHEPWVLKGLGDCLPLWHPSLIIEIWNNEVGGAVEEILKKCNYIFYALTTQGPLQCSHLINNLPDKGFINYLICTELIAKELTLNVDSRH